MVENGLLVNRKICLGLESFFILDTIQKVFGNDNDTLRNELNLDFSPEVISEKQVTFSVETSRVEAIDFSAHLVAVKVLFTSEIYELKRKVDRLRETEHQ